MANKNISYHCDFLTTGTNLHNTLFHKYGANTNNTKTQISNIKNNMQYLVPNQKHLNLH